MGFGVWGLGRNRVLGLGVIEVLRFCQGFVLAWGYEGPFRGLGSGEGGGVPWLGQLISLYMLTWSSRV